MDNKGFDAASRELPTCTIQFSAAVSLTNAAAQFMPAYNAAASSLTALPGALVVGSGQIIARARIRFTGDGANVAQTIAVSILRNGVAFAALAITGVATTAGTQTGVSNSGTPLTPGNALELADGDIITATITPSAGLGAVLTGVTIALGP